MEQISRRHHLAIERASSYMSDIIARPRLLSVTESHCALAPTEQAVRCNHVETNVFASDPSKCFNASVGVRNPSLSGTGFALHRIDFVSSQFWLLHLREARAVAGCTGMLSYLRRHRNLSGRLDWRPHFLAYCSTDLARYLRAGGQNSTSPPSPRHLYESTSHIGLSDVSAIAFGGVDQLSSICGQNARADGLMYGSISAFA